EGQIAVFFGAGVGGAFSTAVFTHLAAGAPMTLAVGDFNGDKRDDLVVSGHNPVQLLIGKGNGTFDFPTSFVSPNPGQPVVGDFNGDGRADVAWTDSSGAAAFYALSTGPAAAGKYGPPQKLATFANKAAALFVAKV